MKSFTYAYYFFFYFYSVSYTHLILAQELGISPILGQLLVQRGITKAADAKKFFRPQLPDLHDPFLMKDMDLSLIHISLSHTYDASPHIPLCFPQTHAATRQQSFVPHR